VLRSTLPSSLVVSLAVFAAPTAASADALRFYSDLHAAARAAWLAELKPGTRVPWIARDGRELELHEWRGTTVSLLTERDDYDPVLVQRLIDALDAFWLRCREICGNTPKADPSKGGYVENRMILAEAVIPIGDTPFDVRERRVSPVTSSAGVARANIGTEELERLLRGLATEPTNAKRRPSPLGDRVPTALARCFVYFEDELGQATPKGFSPLATALAEVLAGAAADSLGWVLPPDQRPLDAWLDRYERDPTATYRSSLKEAAGHLDANAEALWTAILFRAQAAAAQHDFVPRLWRTLSECPIADDGDTALGNLLVAISAASRADAAPAFKRWKIPVPESARERVRQALAPKEIDARKATEDSRDNSAR
jgi:hypothetical protein